MRECEENVFGSLQRRWAKGCVVCDDQRFWYEADVSQKQFQEAETTLIEPSTPTTSEVWDVSTGFRLCSGRMSGIDIKLLAERVDSIFGDSIFVRKSSTGALQNGIPLFRPLYFAFGLTTFPSRSICSLFDMIQALEPF